MLIASVVLIFVACYYANQVAKPVIDQIVEAAYKNSTNSTNSTDSNNGHEAMPYIPPSKNSTIPVPNPDSDDAIEVEPYPEDPFFFPEEEGENMDFDNDEEVTIIALNANGEL